MSRKILEIILSGLSDKNIRFREIHVPNKVRNLVTQTVVSSFTSFRTGLKMTGIMLFRGDSSI